jgi:hypothetical protein
MRVIIAGSESIRDDAAVKEAIRASGFHISEIVSGGAKGVDESGERIAAEEGIPLKRFPADWDRYGKKAGPIRNTQMARYADALVAVWDGKSPGTRHMINAMRKAGKPSYVLVFSAVSAFSAGLEPPPRYAEKSN